jgi:tagatose 6-phosphate kinase
VRLVHALADILSMDCVMPDLLALTPNLTIDKIMSVPSLRPGEVHRVSSVSTIPGGKGINVARVVRALGFDAEVSGFLGGFNGRFAQSQYEADGLRGHFVWYEGETRYSILINEPDGRSTVINEVGAPLADEYVLELARHIREVKDQFRWFSSSGSVQPGAAVESYLEIVEAARPLPIAVDSHGRLLVAIAHHGLDLLRINNHEASELLGYTIDTVEAAASACATLHSWGNHYVAISLGEPGAVGHDGRHCWHASPPPIQVTSNVGAGDAMFAGMLAAFMEGKSFVDALRQGVASGSANCTSQEPGGLPVDTYRQLVPQVAVRQL